MSSQAIRADKPLTVTGFALAEGYDRVILLLYLVLICIGLVMVASASIGIADQNTGDPFFYAKRQFLRILLSLGCCGLPAGSLCNSGTATVWR